ncbi:hypothetical protein PLICRDRAFT_417247 [Plicaturopsis crispa FD-325 SS-3]|nr:hypothetical protein PLICRDRAFT_417247 [Plicaturopsis crispa FD-325 SS-3]
MSNIPEIILQHLRKLEPDAHFTSSLPDVQSSSGARYYAKVGSPTEAEQYIGEAESLLALTAAAPGLAPRIFAHGVDSGRPYFLSEYKELGSLSDKAAQVLARRMATELHQHTSDKGFGFGVPTYCGMTRFANGWFGTWEECYDSMIGDMVQQMRKKGRFAELCRKTEEVQKTVIPALLGGLDVQPVILHGDLWSGNVGTDSSTGEPVIFDPASYYGHNEADLAIARVFGGFPASFFTVYHQHHPKTEPVEQYEFRAHLYEFFHYLNHTLIFGGAYAGSATNKLDILLKAKAAGKF